MTPAETSRALALAIGYLPEHVRIGKLGTCQVFRCTELWGPQWYAFNYQSPGVIWRIAERYDAFPYRLYDGRWWAASHGKGIAADAAALAVALVVIGGAR